MRICVTTVQKNWRPAGRVILADTSSTAESMLENAAAVGYLSAEVTISEVTVDEYREMLASQPQTNAECIAALKRQILAIQEANQFTHRFWRDYFKLVVEDRPELATHPLYARILDVDAQINAVEDQIVALGGEP